MKFRTLQSIFSFAVVLGLGVLLLTPKDIFTDSPAATAGDTAAPVSAAEPERAAVVTIGSPAVEAEFEAADAPEVDRRWITARSLNLRVGPNMSAGVVTSLKFGTEVEVGEVQGSWLMVTALNGATGWLSSAYVSDTQPSAN